MKNRSAKDAHFRRMHEQTQIRILRLGGVIVRAKLKSELRRELKNI